MRPSSMAAHEFDLFNHALEGVQLIEASAGTGKTWTICALYLRLLLEKKIDVERILVVTFTKAATAELRERIRARITDVAHALAYGNAADDPLTRYWCAFGRAPQRLEAQLRLERARHHFDQAAIYTVHGFCQRALLDAPFASAHPPEFEIQEDDEALRLECAIEFWRAQVEPAAAADANFADWLIQHQAQPATLAQLLARRARKPLARLMCGEESDPGRHRAAPSPSALPALFKSAGALWRAERDTIAHRLQCALPGLRKSVYKPDSIERAFHAWDRYFDTDCVGRAPEGRAELLGAARLKQSLNKGGCVPEHAFFESAEALLDAHAGIEHAHRLKWQTLVRAWFDWGSPALLAIKRTQCCVSYQDLLTHLQRALKEQPALAHALQARYSAALVDEFQDTDPLQFDIFQRLFAVQPPRSSDAEAARQRSASLQTAASGACPLFLVGDPKQAIYGFRAADLHTYLAARRTAAGHATLTVNQRACPALIDACNRIFSVHRHAFILDGLHYTPVTASMRERPPLLDTAPPCRIWLLPGGAALMHKNAAFQAAAQACAAEIVRLLESARIGDAPLAPSDIAVLVQTRAQGSLVKQVLSKWAIGSVELAQTSIFETEDAEGFERLLRALEAPHDMVSLRAALVNDWFEVDPAALADAQEGCAAVSDLTSIWAERFARYRALWQARGFAACWRTLMHELKVAQRLAAQPAGERRLTNLNHLAEHIQTYAAHAPSIAATLRWLIRQRAVQRSGPAPEALRLRLESDRALVRIATVHVAKGLEYPVVLCPFLNDGDLRLSSASGLHQAYEYHDQDGHALFHYAPGKAETASDSERDQAMRIEQAAERARLIYVALTRAIYHCTFVAGPYAISTTSTRSSKPSVKQSCSGVLNWLVTGTGRDFTEWFAKPPQSDEIAAGWHALASDTLKVEPLPIVTASSQHRSSMSAPSADTVWRARMARRRLQEEWRIASFTSLTARSALHAPGLPAAAADTQRAPVSVPDSLAEDDILHFPRGAYPGQCLHRLLEYADLSTPQHWPAAIARTLREYPELARRNDRLAAMMSAVLNNLAAAELMPGWTLSRVDPALQRSELEFIFPAAALDLTALDVLLNRYGYSECCLTAETLCSYLRGAIDRVFQYDGRFWMIDWKSNHLGYTADCYAPAQLRAEIGAHAYHLQTLLYTLAVHRYLRLCLPDYDYARHFGGALTLFIRGIRPAWRIEGHCTGVQLDTPAPALINALDQWIAPKKMA